MQLEPVKYKPDKSSQQEKDGENIREDEKKKKKAGWVWNTMKVAPYSITNCVHFASHEKPDNYIT